MKCKCTFTRTAWTVLAAAAMSLSSISASAEYVKLTALSGSRSITDGEGCQKLVDGVYTSKWGQSTNFSVAGTRRYVIVKAEKAFTPENYFLITGNDTNGDQARNWKAWTISGANFESDADATLESEAWTAIDQRETDDVSVKNYGVTAFTLNDTETTVQYDGTPYQYYLIEVTAMKEDGDHYMQMSEFGFGTYAEFNAWVELQAADPTKPVTYAILEGTKNNGDDEGLPKLFDGQSSTKWGNGFTNRAEGETDNGAYFVVKASRPIAPTYYVLTTANDTKQNPGRNWRQWQIYGMNAQNDVDVTRNATGWVAIDKKYAVGTDQLPADNYTDHYFTLSEGSTTAYKYYKVEIDEIVSSGQYMQMAEWALGDANTLAPSRNNAIETAKSAVDLTVTAQKTLIDAYNAKLDELSKVESPAGIGEIAAELAAMVDAINKSAYAYSTLQTAVDAAKAAVAQNEVDAEAVAYLTQYLSDTTIEPNDEYPAGNYAYITTYALLDTDGAKGESQRVNAYLDKHSTVEVDPIANGSGFYTAIDGSGGFNAAESHEMLIDGDRENTKWCASKPSDGVWWMTFKSADPIRPTYYGLVTGGDTNSYPSRNWKTWNIYAGEFESDEEVTRESDKWVLIDAKKNVGSDILATYNKYESYISLSAAPTKEYKYFKIEVLQDNGANMIQMNEFTFYNQGNFHEYKEVFVDDVNNALAEAGIDMEGELIAYKPYLDQFKAKYQQFIDAPDAPSLMSLKNQLMDLVPQISGSIEMYDQYQVAVEEFDASLFADYEQAAAWAEGYMNDVVAPGNKYIRGTSQYILTNMQLDNAGISAELAYLEYMTNAATDPEAAGYIVLGGNTVNGWGDGHYSQLVDNIVDRPVLDSEGNQKQNAAGELMYETKWGGDVSSSGDTYVIFRTIDAVNPYFYTLTTGGDTYSYQGRNWKTWEIYGANFEGDGEATKDAEGWVLVDRKENIGQNRLHPESMTASYFGFSTETTEKYLYYKVVVYAAYSGGQFQMQELRFGTEEEFANIKSGYILEAQEFNTQVTAEQALLDAYAEKIEEFDDCINMEALFRVYDDIQNLQAAIKKSMNEYEALQIAVAAVQDYLDKNALSESEALTTLKSYITDDVEPNEVFTNGSAKYINDVHEINDSTIEAELKSLEAMKVAAVAVGYGKGMDISSLIVNRSLGEKAQDHIGGGIELTGWNGVAYRTATNALKTMSSAEFCNEAQKFDINQTLTNLKNGYYKVTLNAGFRANGNLLSYNYAAYAYANETATFIPVIRECTVADSTEAWLGSYADKMIYSEDSTETYGLGIWSPEGANNAFLQGRYAITMIAKVTDGTLTIGAKNEGTAAGGDWTGIGNYGLVYLGEEEADAAETIALANEYNQARATVINELYRQELSEGDYEAMKATPNFGAAQKAAVATVMTSYADNVTISETVKDIPATKLAYVAFTSLKDKVYDKWTTQDVPNAVADQFEEDVYTVIGNLDEGAYGNTETTLLAATAFVEKYPSYLNVEVANDNTDIMYSETEAFSATIESLGKNPTVVMKNIYEGVQRDSKVYLTFEYTSTEALSSRFYIGKDADDSQMITLDLEATAEPKTVTIEITEFVANNAVFTSAEDQIKWRLTTGESGATVTLRHAQIEEIQVTPISSDVNGDGEIDVMDIECVLSTIADAENSEYKATADVNLDGEIDVMDIEVILSAIANK